MRSVIFGFATTFTLLIQLTCAIAGQLPDSLAHYRAETKAVLAGEQNDIVKKYLQTCLAAADNLNGLEAGDSRVSEAFHKVVGKRLEALAGLTPQTSGAPGVRAEKNAYDTYLQPYVKADYIGLISLQDQLLDRKYFKSDTAKEANFLEAYINGRWSLTRADHGDIKQVLSEPHLGVSPWEAIFRLEPAIAIDHGAQPVIIGSAGMSYAFFPDLDRSKSPPVFEEDFWSKWVQKSGGRIGIGAGNIENRVRLLLGTGIQINALGVWGLYQPDRGNFMLGLSAADLGFVKKIVPWFQ